MSLGGCTLGQQTRSLTGLNKPLGHWPSEYIRTYMHIIHLYIYHMYTKRKTLTLTSCCGSIPTRKCAGGGRNKADLYGCAVFRTCGQVGGSVGRSIGWGGCRRAVGRTSVVRSAGWMVGRALRRLGSRSDGRPARGLGDRGPMFGWSVGR